MRQKMMEQLQFQKKMEQKRLRPDRMIQHLIRRQAAVQRGAARKQKGPLKIRLKLLTGQETMRQ